MKSMNTPICDDEVHEVLIFVIDFASSFHRLADNPDYDDEEGDAPAGTGAMFSEKMQTSILAETGPDAAVENFEDDMEEEEEDPPNFIEFDADTFSLMMLAPVVSRDWALGIAAVTFQWMILGLILFDQVVKQAESSSTLNIPYSVEPAGMFIFYITP